MIWRAIAALAPLLAYAASSDDLSRKDGAYVWREQPWLSERNPASTPPRQTRFQNADFSRAEDDLGPLHRVRFIWKFGSGYEAVFDSLRATSAGKHTVTDCWRAFQNVRLKDEHTLLLEDGVEDRLGLHWFATQPVQSELTTGQQGTELTQSLTLDFSAGQPYRLVNFLLPQRKPASSVTAVDGNDSSGIGVEVRQADTIAVLGASSGGSVHHFGRISSDAEAILAEWTTRFAGPIAIKYVNGRHLEIKTGLRPDSVTLDGHILNAAEWRFSAGSLSVDLRGASGEIEIRFPKFTRPRLNLNRDWRYLPLDAPQAAKADFDDSYWPVVQIPYSVAPPASDLTGVNWYRKRFSLPAESNGKRVFLEFGAVTVKCDVWLNGQRVGEHAGATSFRFDITPFLKPPGAANVLAVRVDFGIPWQHRVPYMIQGFKDHGGIYEDVSISYTDPLHLDSVFVTTPEVSAAKGTVKIQTEIENRSPTERSAKLLSIVYDADRREVARMETPFALQPGARSQLVQTSASIPSPRLWSPDEPNLYMVVSRIEEQNTILDRVENPLGFRWYRFDPDRGFFLNGKPLKLHGVNMEIGRQYIATAVPDSKLADDLYALKAMGCNFVRMPFVAVDPIVLETADRLGLMVSEGDPITSAYHKRVDTARYEDSARQQLSEMIRRDRNHPSIILWSMMNEVTIGAKAPWTDAVRFCRELNAIAKKEDFTRLTTLAEMPGVYFGCTDISSRNNYHRGSSLYGLSNALDQYKLDHPDYRYFISEYGAPNIERGTFGGGRTDTEEYGALNHELYLRELEKRPWISGYLVWVAFDYNPPGNAHEGIMDESRYPKDAYYFYQGRWAKEPMLQIRSASHWNFPQPERLDSRVADTHDVVIDSNCDTVELFVNGKSQGVKTGPGPFRWEQVAYAPGELRSIGRKGAAILEHARSTAGPPDHLVLTADDYEIGADGSDIAFLQARLVDAEGRLVANSYDPVLFTVEGQGDLTGPSAQKLLAGICTLQSVRSRTEPGEIKVKVMAGSNLPGLPIRPGKIKSAEIVIRTTSARSSVRPE